MTIETGSVAPRGAPQIRTVHRRPTGVVTLSRPLWLLAGVLVLWLSFQDVGVANQMALAAVAVVGLIAMSLTGLSGVLRLFFLAVATFLTLRYTAWRITDTLPDPTTLSIIPAMLLFLAELYGITMFFLGVFVNIGPRTRAVEPLPEDPAVLPTVDVFVPSYNEDADLLETTLIAAQSLRYPADKLRVHLLDDGGTLQKRNDCDPLKASAAKERHETLQALCARLGVGYLTRERNVSAKAGNINAALGKTSGDLILILDADHVPTQDFLEKTVGPFLKDPDLFLVQTPHFFINPDPIERNLNTWERMPSENEMFYCVGQRGLDSWNASFFCGSAAVLRRHCLEEIGGIQGLSITEDAETALELHARGYRSSYVQQPMVAGLQPETFQGFIGQRTRWAQGMLQILLLKNPLFKRGLTFPQRLAYLSSSTFWLFPLARSIFLFLPLTYLFFGFKVYNASFEEFLAYGVSHLIASLLVANHLFGKVRWPFISELYEIAQALFVAPALLSVFVNPRAPTFNVTNKAETLEKTFVSNLAPRLIVVFLLLCAGVAAGCWRYVHFPLEHENLLIVFGWNLLNLFFIGAALGVVLERRQRRAVPRVQHEQPVTFEMGGWSADALITDLSVTGAQVVFPADQAVHAHLNRTDGTIHVAPPGGVGQVQLPIEVCNAVLVDDHVRLGIRFAPKSDADRRHVVAVCFGSSEVWKAFQERRHQRRTILGGLLFVCSLAITKGLPALLAILRDRALVGEGGWRLRSRSQQVAIDFGKSV